MCAECGSTPCLSSCPNRVDKSIGVCPVCNEKILDYEPFYDFDGEKYHDVCFQDNAVSTARWRYESFCEAEPCKGNDRIGKP